MWGVLRTLHPRYMTTSGAPWTACADTQRLDDPNDPAGDLFWGCVNSSFLPPAKKGGLQQRPELKPFYSAEMLDTVQ